MDSVIPACTFAMTPINPACYFFSWALFVVGKLIPDGLSYEDTCLMGLQPMRWNWPIMINVHLSGYYNA